MLWNNPIGLALLRGEDQAFPARRVEVMGHNLPVAFAAHGHAPARPGIQHLAGDLSPCRDADKSNPAFPHLGRDEEAAPRLEIPEGDGAARRHTGGCLHANYFDGQWRHHTLHMDFISWLIARGINS